MSAWWLWALIGLYPLVPGSGELLVTSPLVDDVVLRPRGDTAFCITCDRPAPEACYLVRAELDGERLDRPWVPAGALARAGTLRLTFAAEPDVEDPLWRRPERAPAWHRDLTEPRSAIAAPGVVDPGLVFDDRGGHDVELVPGAWIGQRFGTEVRVTDATITLGRTAAADAVVFEASTDGVTWTPVATTGPATMPADRTTPTVFDDPPAARWWRVLALAPVLLRQLELFDLEPAGR